MLDTTSLTLMSLSTLPVTKCCSIGSRADDDAVVFHWSNFTKLRKYYPSSKQFRDPPTYTHQPSVQQKVPFSLIRCSSSKAAFCSCVEWGWHIYNIVESESDLLTRWPFRKRTPQGQFRGPPTYTNQVWRRSVKGPRRRWGTNRQTDRQTLLDL